MTAAAVATPAAAAPTASKKTWYVVCKADGDPRTRYYNPPVDGGDGSYATWQPSYTDYLRKNYRYDRSVACNKLPSLGEAQAYYDTTLAQAQLKKEINGVQSPVIVITDWKYE